VNYNTWNFWLLFGAVIVVYWRLNHRRQNSLILVSSYVFYGFFDYRFLFLILLTTVVDYLGGLGVTGRHVPVRRRAELGLLVIGAALLLTSNIDYGALRDALTGFDLGAVRDALPHALGDYSIAIAVTAAVAGYGMAFPRIYALPAEQRRKAFLVVSMVANLGILAFFKYYDFFLGSFEDGFDKLGFGDLPASTIGIIVPAGISFYTFQAMSYTIDLYRGHAEVTESFRDFAVFICFFPHLVAGPIMRAHTLLPQVVKQRALAAGDIEEGALLVISGLFMKIVVADNVAPIANAVFFPFTDGSGGAVSGVEALVGIYAFAFQIYCDFAGYSNIARGISKWLGFELIENFHVPYLAVSPSDFWRRWHISLSTWLRDYLYIPLGGNRHGELKTYRNLFLTMLLGGLWHGANWTFVAWGAFHGALLAAFRLLGIRDDFSREGVRGRLHWAARVVLTFQLVCFGWLLFRADSFSTVVEILNRIVTDFEVTSMAVSGFTTLAVYVGLLALVELALNGHGGVRGFLRSPLPARAAFYAYAALALVIFPASQANEFIYFQF
jgi:alginate O-acetyltransferase complex protein AlgI